MDIFRASFIQLQVNNKFCYSSKTLTRLTRKFQEFIWEPIQNEAFEGLKKLCTTPVLTYKKLKLPFIFTTDVSKEAIAAILSQVQDAVQRPIAYPSRQLNTAEQTTRTQKPNCFPSYEQSTNCVVTCMERSS